ncbi:hypothetical protein [Jeongeupia chitinilytica]|uniref:Uncharacterized protein n=1 Tax=Jeongeupia chitinilytica TaxID=1041641 RepID=A0ABQ3GY92_9NEIS|nr:hypothetical protein [Jeongeupia chitinilytica]GHD59472.1 hypothetical protein GCM10007350_11000 [Jeongeupia chitinilytica]
MSEQTTPASALVALPRPPRFLKSARPKRIWSYLLTSLADAQLDYASALIGLALLAEKVDAWRSHVDAIRKEGGRYDVDSNGGSMESDESMAERRARNEVLKDLDQAGLTVTTAARIRVIDRLASQGELFSPFDLLEQAHEGERPPQLPPWTMTSAEKRLWQDLQPLLEQSGFDFSSAGLAIGLLCAAMADWYEARQWLADHKGKHFAVSYKTGRTYEVSASYNRAKIARQIRELLKRNGLTVYACAKHKAISKGRVLSAELAEILMFADQRAD